MHVQGRRDSAVPGEYIIGFKPEATQAQRERVLHGIQPTRTEPLDFIDAEIVKVPKGRGLTSLVDRADTSDVVAWVQPNYRHKLRDAELPQPNDPNYSKQYAHNNTGQTGGTPGADMNVLEAWQKTRGSKSTVVALLDTNIDINHPDIAPNVWTNTGEIPNNKIDDDKNGYVDDVHGWNFMENSNRPEDGTGEHGTHTAGIIAAVADNGEGVAGVAPGVQLMPLPILDNGYSSNAVKAMEYAVKNGAQILSNSWGNNTYEPALAEAVARATKAGAMVVVAAGNENWDTGINGSYPDNYAGSVAIAASTSKDSKASYSNRGTLTIDVATPGDGILSTLPHGKYGKMDGTSMAAPAYAGVAALVKSQYPNLSMKQVEDRIFRSAQRDGSAAVWNTLVASGGRVDAQAALMPIASPTTPGPKGKSVVAAGRPVPLQWGTDIADGQAFEVQASLNATDTSTVDESFEQGTASRAFTTSGDEQWQIGTGDAKTGDHAFKVTGLGRNAQSRLELTESLPEPTQLSFSYKSLGGGNQLSFFVDRNLQFKPSDATKDWQDFTATLPAGEHTFSWLATSKTGAKADAGFAIDDVKIGKVSDAKWQSIGTTKAGATELEWTPDTASSAAQVRVRANNGRWSGDWVPGTTFGVDPAITARAKHTKHSQKH
jgi:subtilisin family serine protease